MSYLVQSQMARDYGLIMRIAACAATEGIVDLPESWADDRRIRFMASPGWAEAYAGCECEKPGECEATITDDKIRAAVRDVIAAEAAATPPAPDPAE